MNLDIQNIRQAHQNSTYAYISALEGQKARLGEVANQTQSDATYYATMETVRCLCEGLAHLKAGDYDALRTRHGPWIFLNTQALMLLSSEPLISDC